MYYYDIQGIKLTDLAARFGTPLYVYDADKIIEKISVLRQSFDGINLKIKYACKANTNISILKLMHKHGVEIDVVSPQELELALKAGYKGEQVTFTPSGVSFDEIETAIEAGAKINLDNLDVLEKFGQKYGNSIGCLIRIKPHVFGGGNEKIMTAHPESKFGISIHQKEEILAVVEKYNIKVIGLHQHTGSDVKNADSFTQAASAILDLAFSFKDLEIIDLGGGFKVAYKEGDVVTDMEEVGKVLGGAFLDFCEKYGKPLQLWFEPGKFLVSESGTFLSTANVVKKDPVKTFVGINSGLNHLIRPMMYAAYHDIFNASNADNSVQDSYRVVGYICETDTFSFDTEGKPNERLMNKVEAGDIIAMKNAGAYGFTMSSNYNARFKPAEVMVYEGKAHLIRKRETMEDILRNQVEIEL
ncbi:diaminopimelate decarboxylase [Pseudarcicella hirudinis]|uniref:Diaminopimelate decarboxylase n=1 Tax=Pseudarcicella hirudinis TaxID=1079859 RepID=A0A1I5RM46_9BACT|nr:diaminopimelate decarboxylase [Pseudarcicella hirudinis]SFP59638.1 diaminopimelate decarboxylase [Pseudarcicella hirudinis]